MKQQYFWLLLSVPCEGCKNHSICVFILPEECKPSSTLKHTSLLTFHTYTYQDMICFLYVVLGSHTFQSIHLSFTEIQFIPALGGHMKSVFFLKKAAETSHLFEVLDILLKSEQGDRFGNSTCLPRCRTLFVLNHSCCLSTCCTLNVFKSEQ